MTLGGTGSTSLSVGAQVVDNIFIEGSVTASLNLSQMWLMNNHFTSGVTHVSDSGNNTYLFRRAFDIWIVDNYYLRGPNTLTGDVIGVSHEAANCTGGGPLCVPNTIWIRGNRMEQHAFLAVADSESCVRVDSVKDAWITENTCSYHAAQGDVGGNGPVGINVQATGTNGATGWYVGNRFKRDVQEDGVTIAGRFLSAVVMAPGAQSMGHSTVRDNFIDGSRSTIDDAALTAGVLPDGPPILSGNVGILTGSSTIDFLTSPTMWLTETTSASERVTSGAISPSKPGATVSTAGNQSYTLADGARDGLVKHVVVFSVTGGGTGTLTPTHFGDGTSITWTASITWFDLAWDATNTTWRILGSNGATVI